MAATFAWLHANATRRRQEKQQGELDGLRKEHLALGVQLQASEAEAAKKADLRASVEWTEGNKCLHLVNGGPAPAKGVSLEVIEDGQQQRRLREGAVRLCPILLMNSGEREVFALSLHKGVPPVLLIRLTWTDGRGEQSREQK